MWFIFITARLFIFLSFQPRLAATLLRSCSVVNSLTRRAGLSPAFQPTSLAQRLTDNEYALVGRYGAIIYMLKCDGIWPPAPSACTRFRNMLGDDTTQVPGCPGFRGRSPLSKP